MRPTARQHLLQLARREEELEVHFCVSVVLLVLLRTRQKVDVVLVFLQTTQASKAIMLHLIAVNLLVAFNNCTHLQGTSSF